MNTRQILWKIHKTRYRMSTLKSIIKADLKRHSTSIFHALIHDKSFKYIFYMRLCKYFHTHKSNLLIKIFIYPLARLLHSLNKFDMEIPFNTQIGHGFMLNHASNIVINGKSIIGNECTINTGVVIGATAKGAPTIGNHVYIMAGAKIIGNITIGNHVMIGANSVVTKDIPNNVFIGGIPAKIIRYHEQYN